MLPVTVTNLGTGKTLTFVGISPKKAVVCAYEQSRGNFNTWTYDENKAIVSTSGATVSCGDFCSIIDRSKMKS